MTRNAGEILAFGKEAGSYSGLDFENRGHLIDGLLRELRSTVEDYLQAIEESQLIAAKLKDCRTRAIGLINGAEALGGEVPAGLDIAATGRKWWIDRLGHRWINEGFIDIADGAEMVKALDAYHDKHSR